MRCPACESTALKINGSERDPDDGITTQRRVCKACGHRFTALVY